MSFAPGQVAGEYRILEQLGSGAFGSVFKVEHVVTHRLEAMKVLGATAPASEEQRLRFLREIQLQARLSHPNIAAVHNAFWHEDSMVMIMELVDGETLQKILERGRPARMEGIGYVVQVLDALTYSHSQGIIHRDVSPANIVVTKAGVVKLTDFGLAKAPYDSRVTATGAMIGSPYYMSPEQVRGIDRLDPRTDIYSCGVILYEILTGQKLFDYESAFSLMRAHLEEEPRPPAEIDPAIPRAVNDVVLRALSKDPRARFPSAETFRKALERAVSPPQERRAAARVLPAPAPGPRRPLLPRFPWRYALRWLAAAVFGVVMAVVLMAAFRWLSRMPFPTAGAASNAIEAQTAADRVIGSVRRVVANVAARHELPALPWSAPPPPPPPPPPKAPRARNRGAAQPAGGQETARGESILAAREQPAPRALESILKLLARTPVVAAPPSQPPSPEAPAADAPREP